MSQQFQAAARERPQLLEELQPEIALFGSHCSFTDNLIRATRYDFRLVHHNLSGSLGALSAEQGEQLRIVVIDERAFAQLEDDPAALGQFGSVRLVLAYQDLDRASACYHAHTLPLHSVIPLDVRLDVWLSLLKLVLLGGKYVQEEILNHRRPDIPKPRAPQTEGRALRLTPQQMKVLDLVAEGLPNKVIAARLGLSDHTVKLHIHNIIGRLGVSNRTEAAARLHDLRS